MAPRTSSPIFAAIRIKAIRVTANFTVTGSGSIKLTLVSYNAPAATFDPNTASQQTIYDMANGTFTAGTYSLTVKLPNNYYQVDFVAGLAIDKFGPEGSNIFFSAQGRLYSADNDGTTPQPTNSSSITGKVFLDVDQDGNQETGDNNLSGVTLKLYNSSNVLAGTTTSGSDGTYAFNNLAAGTYRVVESQPANYDDGKDYVGKVAGVTVGTAPNPDNDQLTGIVLGSGQRGRDYNFTEKTPTGKISGKVFLDVDQDGVQETGDSNLSGVTVKLLKPDGTTVTTTTAPDGTYCFTGLAAGTYSVCEVQPAN